MIRSLRGCFTVSGRILTLRSPWEQVLSERSKPKYTFGKLSGVRAGQSLLVFMPLGAHLGFAQCLLGDQNGYCGTVSAAPRRKISGSPVPE